MVDGREEFCRKYYPTGSRAESQTECLTEAELKQRQDANHQALDDAKRSWTQSTGTGAPPGAGH